MNAIAEYSVVYDGDIVRLEGDGDCFIFKSSRPDLFDARTATFAAWVLLPVAMRKNKELRILANGDDETVLNAEALARTWSIWLPHMFRPVKVSFSSYDKFERQSSDRDLLLYSGGVDSTYNLIMRHEAGLKQSLLTLHGLDYKLYESARFEDMISKTAGFCQEMNNDRIFLEVNAYLQYKKYKINSDIGHGFVLASSLFLLGRKYRSGVISADYSREQEFLVFPWGTNSVTNSYFKSGEFEMSTANLDITRAHKMELISKYPSALNSLTFCGTRSMRPNNCGACSKCMRTKAMFVAAIGEVPDIFLDRSMTRHHIGAINLRKRSERAFFLDLMEMAENNGHTLKIPGLTQKISMIRRPPRKLPRWTRWVKRMINRLLVP